MYASVEALLDFEPKLPSDESLLSTLYKNAPLESPLQTTLITILCAERKDHLQGLNAEIALLTDALSRLKEQKKRVRAQLHVCSSAIHSPIRALPADVMCDILSLAVNLERSSPTACSLLRLTQVCRGWRQAMHDMPSLWRELLLSWNLLENDADAWRIQVCHPWDESDDSIDEEVENHVAGIGDILGHQVTFPTHMIRDLRLVGNAEIMLPHIVPLPRDAFPVLERLHLRFHEPRYDRGFTPSIVAFAESTRLWHLRFEDHIPDLLYDHLHRQSLTDVHLSLFEPVLSRLVFLRQCPHLEHLDFESRKSPATWSSSSDDLVTLGRLHSLSLRGHRCHSLTERISTPNLQAFSWYGATQEPGPDMLSFLERAPHISSFALDEVAYKQRNADGDLGVSLLRRLPRVKRLGFAVYDPSLLCVFKALHIRPGEDALAPDLQELVLDRVIIGEGHGCANSFVNMIRSRWQSSQYRIRRLVYRNRLKDDRIMEVLQNLSDEGLEVEL
ncbi:uncharacterized protein SCHCODRAFT_02682380 [Schizophyllum commune H4-8]|uniref:uncharacterized protein n=1 Tax=Schizophyllum commune (strain H4-8 / FGSC 9210) TaxID=578458 RepID=UPI00215E5D54|nr:uncharacterized protein SCHCODRAFT_02682380 [Schizophyllum commune H4-8]KAI5899352.1 hypothetical protein SCHCODRAFT_02682380 [Schizophyllum commune H4-8]